jgi:hypothetical protein
MKIGLLYINLFVKYESENYTCDDAHLLLFKFRHDDYVGGSAICWRDGRNRLIKHSCTSGEKKRVCNYQGLTAVKVSEGVSACQAAVNPGTHNPDIFTQLNCLTAADFFESPAMILRMTYMALITIVNRILKFHSSK